MGADLFESYVGAILGSMILGSTLALGAKQGGQADMGALIVLPLYLAAFGIVVSIIGTFFVKTSEGGNPHSALHKGTFGAAALMIVGAYFLINHFIPAEAVFAFKEGALDAIVVSDADRIKSLTAMDGVRTFGVGMGIFAATILGLVAGTLIGLLPSTTPRTTGRRYTALLSRQRQVLLP